MNQPKGVEFATIDLSTGVQVHYAEQGDREGEAVVFLHAYVDSWFSYSQVLPLLSRCYHAVVPDQRGPGDSDKPVCCYTADDYAADVDAFMKALGSGGLIAQRVALDYPHRVKPSCPDRVADDLGE